MMIARRNICLESKLIPKIDGRAKVFLGGGLFYDQKRALRSAGRPGKKNVEKKKLESWDHLLTIR